MASGSIIFLRKNVAITIKTSQFTNMVPKYFGAITSLINKIYMTVHKAILF